MVLPRKEHSFCGNLTRTTECPTLSFQENKEKQHRTTNISPFNMVQGPYFYFPFKSKGAGKSIIGMGKYRISTWNLSFFTILGQHFHCHLKVPFLVSCCQLRSQHCIYICNNRISIAILMLILPVWRFFCNQFFFKKNNSK